MNTIPVSVEFLAGVLGTQPGVLSGALKADGKDELKPQSEIDSYLKEAITTKFKDLRKEGHDEGHGRGTRESLSKLEKANKEKYNLKSDSLEDQLEEIIQITKSKSSKTELGEDAIRQSPLFLETVKKFEADLLAKDEEVQTIQTKVREQDLNRSLRAMATSIVESEENKFLLPEDDTIKKTQIDLYVNLLKSKQWKKDGENLIPLGDDKKPLKDDSFNPVSADNFATSIAKTMFPQSKGEARSAPKVGTQPPAAGASGTDGGFTIPDFKTKQEAIAHIRTLKDPKEMEAVKEYVTKLDAQGALE